MHRTDEQLRAGTVVVADSWLRMNQARNGPTEDRQYRCHHGSLLNDAALVHWRALSFFLDGPHHKDSDIRPQHFVEGPWPVSGTRVEERELASKYIVHLSWVRVEHGGTVHEPIDSLFDAMNRRMARFAEATAEASWAGSLRLVRHAVERKEFPWLLRSSIYDV